VFGRNLQCKLVRGVNFRENAIVYIHVRFKRTCVRSNGILECKILFENAHRTRCFYRTQEYLQICDGMYRNNTSEKREPRSMRMRLNRMQVIYLPPPPPHITHRGSPKTPVGNTCMLGIEEAGVRSDRILEQHQLCLETSSMPETLKSTLVAKG
jgi:hypothetical protein